MLSTKLKEAAGNSADATLYVDDVFSTWLYTGNGSTQTINNGIDLAGKGGMVWIKQRNITAAHGLVDTVRGRNYPLYPNQTNPQVTSGVGYDVTDFTSSGFSLGLTNQITTNTNSNTYASWTFRKAAKFFDVVTYTGNGVAGRSIAHSLGVAPGMVIVKKYSGTGGSWAVRHRSATGELILDLASAQDAGGFYTVTAMDASTFTVSVNGSAGNESGGTYVAYLFAHDTSSTGIIQCGSYTGNGTTNNISLGWEAQYVLIKSASSARPWVVFDTMRGFCNSSSPSSNALFPNASTAETSYYGPTPTATGFGMGAGDGDSDYNASSVTYIYMAIRRPNKPPTTGTQVFSPIARTGTGAVTTISAGFPVDLVMSTDRIGNGGDGFFDRLRGALKRLHPVNLNAEDSPTNTLTGFDNSTGVIVGSDPSDGAVNMNAIGYSTYLFKRAIGFFDVVCYTGTGSATTQAHNLGVAPELMIVKERSAVNNWWVYVSSVGNTKYSVLNSTAMPTTDSTAWNNTTPTASVFSIGTSSNVNASTQTFVAYLFATLAGISKVGSYTGNGTGQAIACGFGSGGARFVLIKRTDSTGDWYTYDSARGLTSGSSPYLLLNSTAAEVTGNNGVYASSGGFTLGSTASTTTNISAATYIFLAVA